jgi:gliding motility-associated-like protein
LQPIAQIVNPTCNGDCDGSIILTPQNGTPPFNITWSNSSVGPSINNLCAGSYTATIFDSQGCNVVTNPIVLVNPPIPNTGPINGTDTICIGSNSEIFSVPLDNTYTYNWTSIGNIVSGQTSNQVEIDFSNVISGNTQISVIPFDQNGCQGTPIQFQSLVLEINPIITQIGPFCIYDDCQQLSAIPQGGQFSGIGVDIDEFCPQQTSQSLNQITYTYTLSGCQFSQTSNILVTPKPIITEINPENTYVQICDGDDSATVVFNVISDQSPTTNYWIYQNDTTESDTYTGIFPEGTSYISVFVESNSCFSDIESTSITVDRCPEVIYYIPNSFTPDNDEHNQIFQVIFTAGFSPAEFHLEIWNRWGELIWESYDHTAKWDGTYAGKACQAGVYTWKIRFGNEDNDGFNVINGHLNLLR